MASMDSEVSKIGRVLLTSWMVFLWFILLPVIYFLPQSNCWYYSVKRYILEGFKGKIIPVASKRWRGYHVVYQDRDGQLWEYTLTKMPRHMPWWKLIIYRGTERKYRGKI